jgi:hypothetical protein
MRPDRRNTTEGTQIKDLDSNAAGPSRQPTSKKRLVPASVAAPDVKGKQAETATSGRVKLGLAVVGDVQLSSRRGRAESIPVQGPASTETSNRCGPLQIVRLSCGFDGALLKRVSRASRYCVCMTRMVRRAFISPLQFPLPSLRRLSLLVLRCGPNHPSKAIKLMSDTRRIVQEHR